MAAFAVWFPPPLLPLFCAPPLTLFAPPRAAGAGVAAAFTAGLTSCIAASSSTAAAAGAAGAWSTVTGVPILSPGFSSTSTVSAITILFMADATGISWAHGGRDGDVTDLRFPT